MSEWVAATAARVTEMREIAVRLEPESIEKLDALAGDGFPFYRGVNLAVSFLLAVLRAEDGAVLDLRVPRSFGRLRVTVSRSRQRFVTSEE